jgi:protein disulfide-isomerase A6
MKPDWNRLAREYEGSSSVVIADVDCTAERELCQRFDVKGYPTLKVFRAHQADVADYKGEKYQGPRDFDSLKKYVKDELEVTCDATEPHSSGCSEREIKYIDKIHSQEDPTKKVHGELARLTRMQTAKLKPELKEWLNARIAILEQLQAVFPKP